MTFRLSRPGAQTLQRASLPKPSPAASTPTLFTVGPGDTLQSIAAQTYGKASLWPMIYGANAGLIGVNSTTPMVGHILVIPNLNP